MLDQRVAATFLALIPQAMSAGLFETQTTTAARKLTLRLFD
jgi:hypothetical protein